MIRTRVRRRRAVVLAAGIAVAIAWAGPVGNALGGPARPVEQRRYVVRPGDTLEYRAEVQEVNDAGGRVAAAALVGGQRVAECSLVFSFHVYDDARQEARRAEILALLRPEGAG